MKRKGKDPEGTPAGQEIIIDHTIPDEDYARLVLFEEVTLSRQATSIISKARHLFRLHNDRTHPPEEPCRAPASREQLLPSSIDPEEMREEVIRMLEEDQLYLCEDLTLASFAHELSIQPHHLSRFLNICLRTTFTDLVNSYRVGEAKKRLEENTPCSILDIAYSSGFSSKASFNRVFRRATGMTPSEYRMKMRASDGGPS